MNIQLSESQNGDKASIYGFLDQVDNRIVTYMWFPHSASKPDVETHSHTQQSLNILIQLKTSNHSTSRQKRANTRANRPTRNPSPGKTWTMRQINRINSSSNNSHCPPIPPKDHCTRTMPTRSVSRRIGNSRIIDLICSTRHMGTIPTHNQRHGLTIRHYAPPHPQQVVNPINSQKNQNSARDRLTPCAVVSLIWIRQPLPLQSLPRKTIVQLKLWVEF